jgi:pilus assembly protein CpaF
MEGDLITLLDIFVFQKTGVGPGGKVTGQFRATGIRPRFYDRVRACGLDLPASIFQSMVEIG